MKLMVVGGGGREHAIIKALKKSPLIEKIYALPGNGGISQDAQCVAISAVDIDGVVNFAVSNSIDFAAVIPDDPLAMGAADALRNAGIPCFGPSQRAAIIESSKAFSKEMMREYGIPTAEYRIFDDADAALSYVESAPMPAVIKADGLALGKGVIIAETVEQAREAINAMMREGRFGDSGSTVVIEEFLEGEEVSVLAFTDGRTTVTMPASMDHKRALDFDRGLNTGGMGAICPNPYYTPQVAKRTLDEIILPTVDAMNAQGRTFKGCLYFGLMITKSGPKVIEYNCRFGDPETQAVLPLLESDLAEIMLAVEYERLDCCPIRFSDKASCCVVLASGGYPAAYEKGKRIHFGELEDEQIYVYHAGTKADGDGYITSGGRVLGVTAVRDSLEEAVKAAYAAADTISFENIYRRSDIGARALRALKGE